MSMTVSGALVYRDPQASVRRKILLAIAVTTIVLIVVVCTISRIFLVQRFADIEAARMADSVERAKSAVQDEIVQLDKIAGDNAVFDETYRFMANPSEDYLRSNFGSGTISTLARENYQALAFLDPTARVVAARGYDPAKALDTELSSGLGAHFTAGDKLIETPLAGAPITGIVLIKEGPMLVSARPILTSESKGPIRGVLLMGCYLKSQDLRRLERKTHLSLSVARLDDPELPPDFAFARKQLVGDFPVFVRPLDEETVAGYALFRDIYGNDVVVLKAQMPRTIYRQGQLTLVCLAVALAIAGIVFGLVIEFLLNRLLVSRLSALDSDVRSIAESGDPSVRLACGGSDELARFAEAINRMLDSIQLSQQEKRQAEQRYRTFMDNSPLIAAIKDEEGRYLYINEPFERTFQTTLERVLNNTSTGLFTAAAERIVNEHDREVLLCRQPRQHEEVIATPEGEARQWLSFRFPLPMEGSQRLFGLLSLDITARKKAESELKEAKNAAEGAVLVKSHFLSNISHEIRTPMNGILGLTELVLAGELNTSQHEHISLIKYSAESLLGIVNDVLDFSKLEAGKLELNPADFELHDLLEDCVALLQVLAKRKGLRLVLDMPPDLRRTIFGDPMRLRQILLNLLGNAIKFTHNGEVRLCVSLDAVQGADFVLHFAVRDTGVGIPEDKQRVIFERFSQADSSTTRQFGGTGLGLAISSRLVEMMSGQIWVESRVGTGSQFHFTAKVRGCVNQTVTVAQNSVEPDLSTPDTADSFAKLRILIAEDNRINQIVVERLLKRCGHSVVLVDNGRQALQTLETESFDLLITDVQMPEIDGYQVASVLRRREQLSGARLPILGLSAHAFAEDRNKCFAAGMDAYLTKPVRSEELYRVITELAGKTICEATKELIHS